jgi:hypothetical protein
VPATQRTGSIQPPTNQHLSSIITQFGPSPLTNPMD